MKLVCKYKVETVQVETKGNIPKHEEIIRENSRNWNQNDQNMSKDEMFQVKSIKHPVIPFCDTSH